MDRQALVRLCRNFSVAASALAFVGGASAQDRVLTWNAKSDAPSLQSQATPRALAPSAAAPRTAMPSAELLGGSRLDAAYAESARRAQAQPDLAATRVSSSAAPLSAGPLTSVAPASIMSPSATPKPGDQVTVTFFRVNGGKGGAYTLQPGDRISVRVQNVPELEAEQVEILPDGGITLPLIGTAPVAGASADQVARMLEARYAELRVRDPKVSVLINETNTSSEEFLTSLSGGNGSSSVVITVPRAGGIILPLVGEFDPYLPLSAWREALNRAAYQQYAGGIGVLVNFSQKTDERVFVIGEVVQPGLVDLARADTALTAIAAAGGLQKTAARNRVFILRTAPSGARQLLAIDLEALLTGAAAPQALRLLPGDVVVAPPSRIAQTNTAVEQYVRNLLPFNVGFGFSVGNN